MKMVLLQNIHMLLDVILGSITWIIEEDKLRNGEVIFH